MRWAARKDPRAPWSVKAFAAARAHNKNGHPRRGLRDDQPPIRVRYPVFLQLLDSRGHNTAAWPREAVRFQAHPPPASSAAVLHLHDLEERIHEVSGTFVWGRAR